MKIQKLSWAGVKIETNGLCLLIDAVEDFSPNARVLGAPRSPIHRFSEATQADFALVTHLHLDHFDAAAIRRSLKPEGKVIGSTSFAAQLAEQGFDNRIDLAEGQTFEHRGVVIRPAFSMDGIGDQQVAWIVESEGKRIIHCGDTMWHNQFWAIGRQNEGFDLALLPINGVVIHLEHRGLAFSPIPISLTPEQAATAGKLIRSRQVVPMHYGLFDSPDYQPFPNSESEFLKHAERMQVPTRLLATAEVVEM